MLTVIVFIIIIGLLVFVHELGHFLVAKRAGAKVEEFGFGFPPRIYGVKRGETIYSINWIPLGGFVKILGEDGQEKQDFRSFGAKKIWQRASILAAGVTMNFLLAIILLSVGFFVGLPTAIDDSENVQGARVQINRVIAGSPAESAGLKIGDAIIKMSGAMGEIGNIQKVGEVQGFTNNNLGQEITLNIIRERNLLDLKITPRINPPAEEGAMGVGLTRVADISYPWHQAIYQGFMTTINLIWLVLFSFATILWNLISTGRVGADIAGPVGIYTLTGQAAKMGIIYLLQLTALLSVNLGIINILPFPALDGGRLFFLLIEKIKGSPLNQKFERIANAAGFIFLIALMVLITVRDVIKFF